MTESSHSTPDQILISFVGFQGSGKSTLGKILAENLDVEHYEISEVVKSTTGVSVRAHLPETGKRTKKDPEWLGKALYMTIEEQLALVPMAVVSGIRETEVHDYLIEKGIDLHIFEVVCPAEVRFTRLVKLQKVGTASEFIEHELKERDLGVEFVMGTAQYVIPTSPSTNPNAICRVIVERLKEKGVLS